METTGPMRRYIEFVLKYRWPILVFCAAVTALSLYPISQAYIASSLGELFLAESPSYDQYLSRADAFGSDEVIVIAIEDADPLDPSTIEKLEKAVAQIKAIEDIAYVSSILEAQRIQRSEDGFSIEKYVDLARAPGADRDALRAEMLADDMLRGQVISQDGKMMLLSAELTVDRYRPAEKGPEFVDGIAKIMVDAGFPEEKLRKAGLPVVMAEVMHQTEIGMYRLFPLVGVVLFIVVFFLFRRLWPVFLSMGIALIGVTWTMGFVTSQYGHINIAVSMVPPVLLIVAFSDVIHLCSAYLLELAAGREREDAILAASTDVGRACFYTSLTTCTGFLGLSFVPTPAFRQMGQALGIGVGIALLLAVTLVPIAFSFMATPKPWRRGATSRVQTILDGWIRWMSRVCTQRPWTVIGIFAIAFAAALYGTTILTFETRFADRLGENNQVQKDAAFFEEHFTPANYLDIYVDATSLEPKVDDVQSAALDEELEELTLEWDEDGAQEKEATSIAVLECGGLCDAKFVEQLTRIEAKIEARDNVDAVFSYLDLLRTLQAQWAANDPDAGPMPKNREQITDLLWQFAAGGGENLARLMDHRRNKTRITVRLSEEAMRGTYEAGDEIAAMAREEVGGSVEFMPTGMLYLIGEWLDDTLEGQRRGLFYSFVVIAIMMMFGLRSVRTGLLSMIPNILPILTLLGFMGLYYDELDSDSLSIAMIAIGIGVDDTIHFLMRFRIECKRTADRAVALQRTYDFAGRAIIMTTLTLGLGFLPCLISDYFSVYIWGNWLPFTLFVALMADLFLVPALAQVGILRFPGPDDPDEGEAELVPA